MPKTKPIDIGSKLDDLALSIIETAKDAEFADKLDAFKALTSFYVGKTKVDSKKRPEEEDGDNFSSFRKKLASVNVNEDDAVE